MTLPRMDSVWALYALQNSMMFTPWGPSAVPTGGAGVAAPAWRCTLTSAAIFFFGGIVLLFLSRGHDEEYVVRLCHLLLPAARRRATGQLCSASFRTRNPARTGSRPCGRQTFWIWEN